jgi:glycerol-3-phosphate dehydrogenase (NAD(P)+)
MTMVAEGVPTTESAQKLSENHGVEMPITNAVHQILFGGKNPKSAIAELMAREARAE